MEIGNGSIIGNTCDGIVLSRLTIAVWCANSGSYRNMFLLFSQNEEDWQVVAVVRVQVTKTSYKLVERSTKSLNLIHTEVWD